MKNTDANTKTPGIKIFTGNLHYYGVAKCIMCARGSLPARAYKRSYDDASGGGQLRPETPYSFIAGHVGDLIGGVRLTAELIRRWKSISKV
jgi:hypothetical protein